MRVPTGRSLWAWFFVGWVFVRWGVRVRRLAGRVGRSGLPPILPDDVYYGVCEFVVFEDDCEVEEFLSFEFSRPVLYFSDDGLVPVVSELFVHAVCQGLLRKEVSASAVCHVFSECLA